MSPTSFSEKNLTPQNEIKKRSERRIKYTHPEKRLVLLGGDGSGADNVGSRPDVALPAVGGTAERTATLSLLGVAGQGAVLDAGKTGTAYFGFEC